MKILYVSFIICIIFLAALTITSSLTIPGGYKIFSVLTGSMSASIPQGSLIISRIPENQNDIEQDSIITFEQPGYQNKFVTHRVVNIKEDKMTKVFITKGDSNELPDSWTIPFEQVQGLYIKHIPYVGDVLRHVQSPIGLGLTILMPTVFLILLEIKTIAIILVEMKLQKHDIV